MGEVTAAVGAECNELLMGEAKALDDAEDGGAGDGGKGGVALFCAKNCGDSTGGKGRKEPLRCDDCDCDCDCDCEEEEEG